MENNKTVYCLYRVSTIGQVEKDDIPMQKQCCREFAQRQGWTILKEFSEKGVSGFKKSAKDTGTPYRRSNRTPPRENLISFWYTCSTD